VKVTTYEDVNNAMAVMAEKKAYIAKKESDMNVKINAIKEKYTEDTKDAQRELDNLMADIESFCNKNKSDFEKLRSRTLSFGTIGFRNNPPKVMLLNRKYNNNTVLELVKRLFKGKYIRSKEELNKEDILADYSQKIISDKDLSGFGLKIDSNETFYCEVNWEELQSVNSSKVSSN